MDLFSVFLSSEKPKDQRLVSSLHPSPVFRTIGKEGQAQVFSELVGEGKRSSVAAQTGKNLMRRSIINHEGHKKMIRSQ